VHKLCSRECIGCALGRDIGALMMCISCVQGSDIGVLRKWYRGSMMCIGCALGRGTRLCSGSDIGCDQGCAEVVIKDVHRL
jgi:hypothetical protein